MTYFERIINVETDEITERPYTAKEIAEVESRKASLFLELQEAKDKAEAKAVAEAKLAALGLTADDLKALGLGNN